MHTASPREKGITGEPPTHHLFKYRDKTYLFDVRTGISMRIDDAAYEVLNLLPSCSKQEIVDRLKNRFSDSTTEEVFSGIEKLKRIGLFRPMPDDSPKEIDAYIRRIIKRPSPSLQLAVVQGCNMDCVYCYEKQVEKKNKQSGLMTKDIGERSVEFLIEKSPGAESLNLTFFGGEPLLNWKLVKHLVHYSVKRAKELKRKTFFSLTTNSTLVTDEVARYIKKYNFGLMCSLDGPPDVHNRLRPLKSGSGSFYKSAKGIKRIMKIRSHVTVRATMNKMNTDCSLLFDFFERFGFTRFAIGAATGTSFQRGPIDFGPEDVEMLIRQSDEEMDNELKRIRDGKPLYRNVLTVVKSIHERSRTRIRCGIGKGTTIVDEKGDLYPCHRYLGMEKYRLGDIWKGYDKGKLYDYLHDYYMVKEHCRTCWLRNLCGGPCPWSVAHPDGRHRPPDKDFYCRLANAAFERAVWLYEELKENYPDYFKKLTN